MASAAIDHRLGVQENAVACMRILGPDLVACRNSVRVGPPFEASYAILLDLDVLVRFLTAPDWVKQL